jgi:hypothetical protein
VRHASAHTGSTYGPSGMTATARSPLASALAATASSTESLSANESALECLTRASELHLQRLPILQRSSVPPEGFLLRTPERLRVAVALASTRRTYALVLDTPSWVRAGWLRALAPFTVRIPSAESVRRSSDRNRGGSWPSPQEREAP